MKILNFGSLNIDYVYSVPHFVLPGETISSVKLQVFCGGKGLNQSIALARAGANVYHAGKIGEGGKMLLDRLNEDGVNTNLIIKTERQNGHAIIQVDKKGENCIILHGGANKEIDEKEADFILSHFEKGDLLLLQNEINCIKYIMESAYKKGLIIALNPSPIDENIKTYPLEYAAYFILNEIEGFEITGKKDSEDILNEMQKKFPNSKIALTLGKKGVVYRDKNIEATQGIFDVKVVDTTAAGDTFTGYFLSGIVNGLDIKEMLKRASMASSICVSRKGASNSIPLLDEVLKADLKLI